MSFVRIQEKAKRINNTFQTFAQTSEGDDKGQKLQWMWGDAGFSESLAQANPLRWSKKLPAAAIKQQVSVPHNRTPHALWTILLSFRLKPWILFIAPNHCMPGVCGYFCSFCSRQQNGLSLSSFVGSATNSNFPPPRLLLPGCAHLSKLAHPETPSRRCPFLCLHIT